MRRNIKKYIILILIIVLLVAIGISAYFIFNRNKQKINVIDEENYSFEYDNTWKISKKEESEIELIHKKSKSKLSINISELEDELKYKTVEELFDNILFNIQDQNEDYNLIYKEASKITKNNIDGYKILLEGENNQSLVNVYKQGNKVVIIILDSSSENFDILLDSVNNIIYSFNLNEEKYDVLSNIDIKTEDINFTKSDEVVNTLKGTRQEQIGSHYYLVDYSIPDNFKMTSYSTIMGSYELEGLPEEKNYSDRKEISLVTNIVRQNIFDYIDRNSKINIYEKYFEENSKDSENAMNKFRDEPLSYIYKLSYTDDFSGKNEIVKIVFELTKNRLIEFTFHANNVGVPEELVNMIKIDKVEKVASTAKVEKQDNYLIGRLKELLHYPDSGTEEIVLKVPDNFTEIDNDANQFEDRYYASDYDAEKEIYGYEIEYTRVSFDIDDELDVHKSDIEKDKGEYKDFTEPVDVSYNNKSFKMVECGSTKKSEGTDENGDRYNYYMNEKFLFYELQNGDFLVIIIKANDKDISNDLIEKLTNFEINTY